MKVACLPLLAGILATTPALAQKTTDADKLSALEATAKAQVDAFNKGDAKAIAATYLPAGELIFATGEILSGREEIEAYYSEVFTADKHPQAALEAGSVRFITPGIAIEKGTFHVTAASGEVSSHDYTATLVQQDDGSWLTASVRGEKDDTALPDEKLFALDWLVGDWLIEKEGSRTFISFDWSEHGPYIDARALTEESGTQSTSSTMRIGWDARRDGYVSWHFDALGGYSFGEWTTTGEDSYLIRSMGVTADGESNRGTVTVNLADDGQSFVWSSRDRIIDGELQADRSIRIVKRPPAPKSAKSE